MRLGAQPNLPNTLSRLLTSIQERRAGRAFEDLTAEYASYGDKMYPSRNSKECNQRTQEPKTCKPSDIKSHDPLPFHLLGSDFCIWHPTFLQPPDLQLIHATPLL